MTQLQRYLGDVFIKYHYWIILEWDEEVEKFLPQRGTIPMFKTWRGAFDYAYRLVTDGR